MQHMVFKKELVDGGMRYGENKATNKSCMIAEYIKALGEQDLNNLRVLLNDVLSGECIPMEWKESSVVLVHKGGSKKEVRNY